MDNKKLKEWIATVAEIKDLKPVKSPTHNRLATETVVEIDEYGEEYEVIREIEENPTLGFKLVKLKDIHKLCELNCGIVVTNQIIEKRLCFTPQKHWRTRCATCGNYVSPDGKSLIEGGHTISYEFNKHFKNQDK